MRNPLIIIVLIILFGCEKPEEPIVDPYLYKQFDSFQEFKQTLNSIASISEQTIRDEKLKSFWDSLTNNHQIPFVFGDSVAFLYRGNATTVKWAGDFNGWNPSLEAYSGKKIGLSNVWMIEATFPTDARLDYKIVKDGQWILDQANSYIQYSGFGPNSELRMPEWIFPEETVLATGVNRGSLSENISIQSKPENLNYLVNYKVYTPYGYENFENLPVIYVTDGYEYADPRLGSMIIVLDNLIHQNKITPIIAVFIDPRDPANPSNNRRMSEYAANTKFANFVADELVPVIDANYRTNASAQKRAILGTSMGGWNSAFFGLTKSNIFQLIGIHSPAFDLNIIQSYQNSEMLPLKIFMSTGVIFDTQVRARQMKEVFEQKGYPFNYIEVNEGHSWGNWKALIDEPLMYFFANK